MTATFGSGCHGSVPAVENEGPNSLVLTSPDLNNGRFPAGFTCEGANISPALHWDPAPAGTKSLALIFHDRTAPFGSFVHWVIFNLPPTTVSLPASVPLRDQLPDGSRQGRTSFDSVGYGGPCPPGHDEHQYVFVLFALDANLNLPGGATRAQLDDAMKGHVLARGTLMATYSR